MLKKRWKVYYWKWQFWTNKIKRFFENKHSINTKNVKNSKSVQTKSYHGTKIFVDFSLVIDIKYNI